MVSPGCSGIVSPRPRHPARLAWDKPALGWRGWGAAAWIKRVSGSFCAPRPHSPANFLEEEGNRGLVAAVFGILFSSLCILVLDRDPLPLVPNSSQHSRGKASAAGEPPGGLFTLVPTEGTRRLCSLRSRVLEDPGFVLLPRLLLPLGCLRHGGAQGRLPRGLPAVLVPLRGARLAEGGLSPVAEGTRPTTGQAAGTRGGRPGALERWH